MEKKCQKYNIYSDAQKHSIFTHFQTFSFQNVPSLRRLTQFIIPQKIFLPLL